MPFCSLHLGRNIGNNINMFDNNFMNTNLLSNLVNRQLYFSYILYCYRIMVLQNTRPVSTI
jgi:hypothetical protein